MIFVFFKLSFLWFVKFGSFLTYVIYDKLIYFYRAAWRLFNGWGIHLFCGRFGAGKSMLMTILSYRLAKDKKQLTILTNLDLTNFPDHTRVLKLRTAKDILNAPDDCLVLIDEIGTIFNSRDFSGGKAAVPKPLFQLLCQCRKRKIMVYGTVQRYNLLDKQIRDIAADVTECSVMLRHPFSRVVVGRTYDIEEYDRYQVNRDYKPTPFDCHLYVQKSLYRHLYDTTDIVAGFLDKEFISDNEIIQNRSSADVVSYGEFKTRKNKFKKR